MSRAGLWPVGLLVLLLGACTSSGLDGAPGGSLPPKDTASGGGDDGTATDGSGGGGGADGVGADAGADAGGTDTAEGDTTGADTGGGTPDVALPDTTVGDAAGGQDGSTGDATDGGAEDAADTALDGGGEDADTEEPGTCETDEDCTFLTAKACCPEAMGPCGGEPDVGNMNDQAEVIAWIAQTCDPADECDPVDPPECDACYVVETLAPLCDPGEKKCVVVRALDCPALCAAKADPDAGECPAISDPTLFTADNLDDCGCP